MEKYEGKSGLYEVTIEKVVTFNSCEGDMQSYPETEVQYVLVKNFENFLIYLHGINVSPDIVGLTYNRIENSVLIL